MTHRRITSRDDDDDVDDVDDDDDDDDDELQRDTDALQLWTDTSWLMQFNPSKCQVLRVTLKRKPVEASYTISGHADTGESRFG